MRTPPPSSSSSSWRWTRPFCGIEHYAPSHGRAQYFKFDITVYASGSTEASICPRGSFTASEEVWFSSLENPDPREAAKAWIVARAQVLEPNHPR